jgi:hypothetical protein
MNLILVFATASHLPFSRNLRTFLGNVIKDRQVTAVPKSHTYFGMRFSVSHCHTFWRNPASSGGGGQERLESDARIRTFIDPTSCEAVRLVQQEVQPGANREADVEPHGDDAGQCCGTIRRPVSFPNEGRRRLGLRFRLRSAACASRRP